MELVELFSLLLPLMAILSLIALLPLILFSRFIFEKYEKMYGAFLLGLTSMLFLDVSYLANSIGITLVYKGFEFLSFFAFIAAVWSVLKNAASIFVAEESSRRLEVEVKQKTAELEQRVMELTDSRTAMLNIMIDLDESQKHLQSAYEQLKELDQVKSNIISNVSHELRTPITIAKGAIELAAEEMPLVERKEILAKGKNALTRLNQVVGDLIAVAKMGKRLSVGEVPLNTIIDDVVKELSLLAMENRVSIETETRSPAVIDGDIEGIRKVFFALLDNAVKFNKKGGQVKITSSMVNSNVNITIEDTGVGISREEFEKIFQPLYQVDATTTRKYPGTGMGLAIVNSVVKAHGGRVTVESEVGKGSRFTVVLPVKQPRKVKGEVEQAKEL